MNEDQSIIKGVVAIAIIVLLQISSSHLQKHSNWYKKLVSNKPVELMRDGKISEENLKRNGISKDNLMAKLREANALNFENVISVVLETTGDISVLHSNTINSVSNQIMNGVDRIQSK